MRKIDGLTATEGALILKEFGIVNDLVYIMSSEANIMYLDEEEIIPEFLSVNEYSDVNLCEGDEISVITYALSDDTTSSILYDHDYVYSVIKQEYTGEVLSINEIK